ncbi:MAG: phytanoyl-CoA dioxygenase family protein [Gammaproteobacteria bacterium]|nr:phytanoyl-CoA dioxygenase family protein [Gammaproteobacteria bacterium]MYF30422.1 phytanoyl-CoA dioxygenase family protein [Gammaproteobacteria bacterium]MYK47504.1 phytanoyl-CoA dioxygenase family protein [Gammaproteobacteria bacterium]
MPAGEHPYRRALLRAGVRQDDRTGTRRAAGGRLRRGCGAAHLRQRREVHWRPGPPPVRQPQSADRRLHVGIERSALHRNECRWFDPSRRRVGEFLPPRWSRRRVRLRHRRLRPDDRLQQSDRGDGVLRERRQPGVDLCRSRNQPPDGKAPRSRRSRSLRQSLCESGNPVRGVPSGRPVRPQPVHRWREATSRAESAGRSSNRRSKEQEQHALLRDRRCRLGHAHDPHRGQRVPGLPPHRHEDGRGVHGRSLASGSSHAAARPRQPERPFRGTAGVLEERAREHAGVRLDHSAGRRLSEPGRGRRLSLQVEIQPAQPQRTRVDRTPAVLQSTTLGTGARQVASEHVDEEVARYFPAAQINEIPDDLSKPRHILAVTPVEQRRARQEHCATMTEIWNSADSDAGRRAVLDEYKRRADADPRAVRLLEMFLREPLNRLPLTEIEFAMDQLGLTDEHNDVLSDAERESLDRDGYVDLGPLLHEDQLQKMRERYDAAIVEEGADAAEKRGIGRIMDTVVKPMNRDGLLDPIFMHPRLLAVVRHVLGVHLKYIGSNYHCAIPGYGHQGIHADFSWGVKGEPQVVNAVWLIDEFTEENGATRVVPGTHRLGIHPSGDLVNGAPRDLNAPVDGEVKVTARAGSCFVYNAHLWHGGTQNCTSKLRRAQHAFFGRSTRPSSTDVPAVIDKQVFERLGRVARAILDIG